MPSSVSFCTTSSGLSPFTRAKPTVSAGRAGRPSSTGPVASSSAAERRRCASAPRRRATVRGAPGRRRSTRARWWRSSSDSTGALEVGDEGQRPGMVRRVGAIGPGYRNAERIRDRKPASAGATSSPRCPAYSRRSSSCSGVRSVGHVARRPARSGRPAGAARGGARRGPGGGTPDPVCVPRGTHEVLGAVEGLELEVGAERGLGEAHREVAAQVDAVAREAVVRPARGRGRRGRRSGPPRGPAAPRPARRSVEPVSTPAGMSIGVGALVDAAALAAAVGARVGDDLARGRRSAGTPTVLTIWPRNDWRTRCTWPAPAHSRQVIGSVPGARAGAAAGARRRPAARTSTGWRTPNTASVKLRSTTSSRSGPAAGRWSAAAAAAEGAAAAEEGLEDVVDPAAAEAERVAGTGADAVRRRSGRTAPLLGVGTAPRRPGRPA